MRCDRAVGGLHRVYNDEVERETDERYSRAGDVKGIYVYSQRTLVSSRLT
jgi:hypothetical protein